MNFPGISAALTALCLILSLPVPSLAQPVVADNCLDAEPIGFGEISGSTLGKFADTTSRCDDGESPDVWFKYEGPQTGDRPIFLDTSGSSFNTVVSLHTACTLTPPAELGCIDDRVGDAASLRIDTGQSAETYVRLTGARSPLQEAPEEGAFTLTIGHGGTLSGRVVDQDAQPLEGVVIHLRSDLSFNAQTQSTDPDGRFLFEDIPPGLYFLITVNTLGYRDVAYPDIPCPPVVGQPCGGRLDDAKSFQIGIDSSIDGVDFVLHQGARIGGTVRDERTGEPIAEATLIAFSEQGVAVRDSVTDRHGRYQIRGLEPGRYLVATVYASGQAPQLYPRIECPMRGCRNQESERAQSIEVSLNEDATEIDFALAERAVISGAVTRTLDGSPVNDLGVWLLDAEELLVKAVRPDSTGRYRLGGLDPGFYFVFTTHNPSYVHEVHPNLPCGFTGCDPIFLGGELLELSENEQIGDIDFELDLYGSIRGTVTDASTGTPLAGIALPSFIPLAPSPLRFTDENGEYAIEGLVDGTYRVSTSNRLGWVDKVYNDISCALGRCDPEVFEPVVVEKNTVAEAINFALERGGAISGRVVGSRGGVPIPSLRVELFAENGQFLTGLLTDGEGRYTMDGLSSGSYFVSAGRASQYVRSLYRGQDCHGPCDLSTGTPIHVVQGQAVADIDFALKRLGGLEGLVTDAQDGRRLAGLDVELFNTSGEEIGTAKTDGQGRYRFIGLEDEAYFVAVPGDRRYQGRVYRDLSCPDDPCDPTRGLPIAIEPDRITSGIDFSLNRTGLGCVRDATTLCLNDGRFRVAVEWATEGLFSAAPAVDLTRDSGYFWFFNPDNVEIVAKVLDGCSTPTNRFWFFAGGLTDVATALTVTDTWTGESRVYQKDQGVAFRSVLDTQAFDSCTATEPTDFDPTSNSALEVRIAPREEIDSPVGACSSGSEALCLNQGRFLAEISWRAFDGQQGRGQAVQLTRDSGYFWFFNEDNVEIVLKVLNGCDEPQQSYWAFAAGLTNIEVILTITDTLTGEVQRYVNPQGQVFEPILDTRAFVTCP